MNRILVILLFISLALSGYQDMVDVELLDSQALQTETTASFSPTKTKLDNRFIDTNKELTSFYTGNGAYVQTLYRISQESEYVLFSNEQVRLLHKFITNSLLKDYNSKQKISEHVSTIQSITQSTLHYYSAHLIFLLRRIVI